MEYRSLWVGQYWDRGASLTQLIQEPNYMESSRKAQAHNVIRLSN